LLHCAVTLQFLVPKIVPSLLFVVVSALTLVRFMQKLSG
jgi:hypothetical protein